MQEALGIKRFHIMRDMGISTSDGVAAIHVAMAYVDDRQVELIEPTGGSDELYRAGLPKNGEAALFHHFGCLVKDEQEWDQLMNEIRSKGIPTAAGRESRGDDGQLMTSFVYVDRRASLGHITEFMYFPGGDRGCGLFDTTPRFYS